ncbi:MAG TPA: hypothetical protein VL688_12855 [Verrucomicrobiae bacterium]|nr:hypothetical protein [Verrucomicrobiae bacterium]
MTALKHSIRPEEALRSLYGKTSVELGMSEKRRDEVIAAAIFTCFRNQEFGTRFHLPPDYKNSNLTEDAQGIDMAVTDTSGRKKNLQIKGIHIQRSIERRRLHKTRGGAIILGRKTQRQMRRDSEELTRIMKGELNKIVQDYSGIILLIHVIADLATQTSLDIAIKQSQSIVQHLKSKEVWFLRNIPVRVLAGQKTLLSCYCYKIIRVAPDRQTYVFTFAV